MRVLIFFAYSLLALIGCDVQPSNSMVNRADVNGVTVLHSVVTRSKSGLENFSCRTSDSGRCHYVVFVERCAAGKSDSVPSVAEVCTQQILSKFDVAVGKTQEVAGLGADFKLCVKNDLPPDASTCTGA